MKRYYPQALAIFALILTACGSRGTSSETISTTFTPDPCTSESLEATIKPINDLQREFDDASLLASNLPREQLPPLITEMQRIHRDAEDQTFPSCLAALKAHQLGHMKTVIDTMLAFVSGADKTTLNNGIAQASQQHDQYTLEMARLLGITLDPATNAPAPSETPSP